jgi:hypothetical protein
VVECCGRAILGGGIARIKYFYTHADSLFRPTLVLHWMEP